MKYPKHERPAPVLFRAFTGHSSRLVTAGIAAVIILSGGSAAAFWNTFSAGSGAAATGVSSPLTLSAGSATAGLYPGGTTAVAFVASNPNSTAVTVSAFALDVTKGTQGFAVDAGHSSCELTALSFVAPSNPSGWAVPARSGGVDGSLPVSLAGALAMDSSAPSACQGATFTVYLRVAS